MDRRLGSLARDISPPPVRREWKMRYGARSPKDQRYKTSLNNQDAPSLAAIEAGQAKINDHLDFLSTQLGRVCRITANPRLLMNDFCRLYERNQHHDGCHFVVHQHDHPVSGVHYDLRLQFSDTSTISFAVPYGLPGNPNSSRPNRMAIETRVHTLWNNLMESASHVTGSLLIWDTGEYEILPWKEVDRPETDDEVSEEENVLAKASVSQSERLFSAFQCRHIRLRLRGHRLPHNYTVSLRLPLKNNRDDQPRRPVLKRRRIDPAESAKMPDLQTDSESEDVLDAEQNNSEPTAGLASEDDHDYDDEEATIRAENAYTGAHNTIGSIHQRHWFLTLDRKNSGFRKGSDGTWEGQWSPFFVMGRDHERSIVTGRNADEVMGDEGVAKFVGRKMWRPILE